MMVAVTNEFYNKDTNWIIFSVKVIIFFNIIGILILVLEKKDITYERILIYTIVGVLLCCIIYLKHIKKIILTDERLIISYNYRTLEYLIYNCNIKEKVKQRGLIRYYRLIIKNENTKRTIKIDSDEWNDYEKIKEVFLRRKLLENKI